MTARPMLFRRRAATGLVRGAEVLAQPGERDDMQGDHGAYERWLTGIGK